MSIFTKNVNEYIKNKKIKKSYIALKSGMNINKISRILNGQEATEKDMKEIASALSEKLEFFISEKFEMKETQYLPEGLAFYSGNINEVNKNTVLNCIDLLETVHSILGRRESMLYSLNKVEYDNREI